MMRAKCPVLTSLVFVGATLLASEVVSAQQPKSSAQPKSSPQPKAAPQQVPPKAAESVAAAAPAGDSALRLRVEQLEEQLVDMQVVIGTLESLARGGGAAASSGSARATGGGDPVRVEQLEAQVRQLQSQVEQMNRQMRERGDSVASAQPTAPLRANPPRGGFETQVTPADRDPIGQIIGNQSTPPPSARPSAIPAPIPGQATVPTPSFPQAQASDASSKQLYETAYGLLLQQDYGAAEAAFDEFLRRFANDPLAGNAQYWLGETHYVRGQFKPAAASFLKGYQTYARSSKAPDSLLKLGMSLDRLGQRDAACSSYSELAIKFPTAPGAIKNRADNERRRIGCP